MIAGFAGGVVGLGPVAEVRLVCEGCWRSEPLACSPHDPDLLFCAQCLALQRAWFQHGDGSESSRFGRHMLGVARGRIERRRAYERERLS